MLNIVIFGPPGAGKGTQAEKLITKYNLVHLSTGDILRAEIAQKTALGLQAQEIIARGELVSDAIVIGMIKNKIEANKDKKGFIFDGFPRTGEQAKALDNLLQSIGTKVSGMLALEVEKQELINRILLRGKDSGRADDQDVNIVENRIKVYNEKTAPLIDYYSKQNKYHGIQGVGTIDEIFSRLCKVIDNL